MWRFGTWVAGTPATKVAARAEYGASATATGHRSAPRVWRSPPEGIHDMTRRITHAQLAAGAPGSIDGEPGVAAEGRASVRQEDFENELF